MQVRGELNVFFDAKGGASGKGMAEGKCEVGYLRTMKGMTTLRIEPEKETAGISVVTEVFSRLWLATKRITDPLSRQDVQSFLRHPLAIKKGYA